MLFAGWRVNVCTEAVWSRSVRAAAARRRVLRVHAPPPAARAPAHAPAQLSGAARRDRRAEGGSARTTRRVPALAARRALSTLPERGAGDVTRPLLPLPLCVYPRLLVG